ncbi:MAG: hypothetical protein B9S33_02580 [Pedosphaera sp. Tous-C6FEB]|nr:MAG: hypothetical protein B9S33_02580 [Pedosphaera sp. Tous-C6FEB]
MSSASARRKYAFTSAALLLSLCSHLAMNSLTAAIWEPLAPLPEPNGGFVCGAIGDNVVVAGGTNWKDGSKHWLDRIWVYEPARKAWREAGRLPVALAYGVAGNSAGAFWFAGGSDGRETHTQLWRMDAKFAVTTVAKIEPRLVYASGAVLDGRLHAVAGAADQAKVDTLTNAAFAFDLKSGAAQRLADLPSAGIITGTAAACGGRLFVFSGAHWDAAAKTVVNTAAAFAFSPKSGRWDQLAPVPFPVRGLTAVALDERHLYLAGGYKNEAEAFTAEAFIFDTQTGKYQPSTALPYRAMVGLVVAGEWLYCLGGEDRMKHRSDAVFRLRWKSLLSAGK